MVVENLSGLSRRERQIMEIIYKRSSATAAEVQKEIPDELSYSTVRALLRMLEEEGRLRHEKQGLKYLFFPPFQRRRLLNRPPKICWKLSSIARSKKLSPLYLEMEKDSLTDQELECIAQITKKEYFHTGIDIRARIGTPIMATANGKVIKGEFMQGYGNTIILEHKDEISTYYTKLSTMKVKPGDSVKKGELIGYFGNSGISTGPHLHYEIRVSGNPMDPLLYIK